MYNDHEFIKHTLELMEEECLRVSKLCEVFIECDWISEINKLQKQKYDQIILIRIGRQQYLAKIVQCRCRSPTKNNNMNFKDKIVEVISNRMKVFKSTGYNKHEERELFYAIEAVKNLIPPELFENAFKEYEEVRKIGRAIEVSEAINKKLPEEKKLTGFGGYSTVNASF